MKTDTKVFRNTFAPTCKNRTLTIGSIIVGLGHGLFKYDKLPQEVRDAVDAEMERRERAAADGSASRPNPDETWKLDVLDACLDPWQNPNDGNRVPPLVTLQRHMLLKRSGEAPILGISLAAQNQHRVAPLTLPRLVRGSAV